MRTNGAPAHPQAPRRGSRRRLGTALLAAAGVVALLTGIAVAVLTDGSDTDGRTPVAAGGSALDKFPSAELRDWASFANQLSVFTVVDEAELPPPPPPSTSGGLTLRKVTLRIDRTLWQRAGTATVDGTLAVKTWGFVEEDGKRYPQAPMDGPRLEVGHRYLAPIVRSCDEWFPLSDSATVTLDGDVITSEVSIGKPSPAASALHGLSIDQAADTVNRTEPSPAVEAAGSDLSKRLAAANATDLGC